MDLSGKKVTLLETGQRLTVRNQNNNAEVSLPPFDPNKIKSEYAYVIRIETTYVIRIETR
jgi:hypothetical protein